MHESMLALLLFEGLQDVHECWERDAIVITQIAAAPNVILPGLQTHQLHKNKLTGGCTRYLNHCL